MKSWEPEILLSGIVLYGMFQVPPALDRFLFFFSNEVYNDVNALDLLVALLKIGVYWLIVGLVLHLICRGLWIGLVGLSYSFPRGIRSERLKYQPKYLKRVSGIPPFEDIILKLERLCSIIYSVSFLLFMSLIGTYFFLSVFVILPVMVIVISVDSLGSNQQVLDGIDTYINALFVVGGLGIIDFMTMGFFRRFKILGKIYWPLYWLFSFFTLAKYYRPTYYAVVTNMNRWGLFVFLLLFVFASLIGVSSSQISNPGYIFSQIDIWTEERGEYADEGSYQDRGEARPSVAVQIPSDIIEDDVLRVFLPVQIDIQDSLRAFINYDSISELGPDIDPGKYFLESVSDFYRLTIADSTFESKMYFSTLAATNQRGYITYLDISFLDQGLYELTVEGPSDMFERAFAIVPFYKLD